MKKRFKKTVCALLAIVLTAANTACTMPLNNTGVKDSNLNRAKVNETSIQNPAGGSGNIENGYDNSDAFVSRVAGTYYGTNSYGNDIMISLFSVFDNLYGFGAYTEGPEGDVYSFWALEIFPYAPEDFFDENKDNCDIEAMAFSSMANIGRYWGPPEEGNIEITSDGIKLNDTSGMAFGFGESVSLKKSDKEDIFLTGGQADDYFTVSYNPEEELFGVWKCQDAYLAFEDGGESGKVTVYRKDEGENVTLFEGKFKADDGNLEIFAMNVSTYNPSGYRLKYGFNDKKLVFEGTEEILPVDSFLNSEEITFDKIGVGDVPLVVLYEADDVEAIKGGLTFNSPYGQRDIKVQLNDTEDVENNGTYFVRVGDVVFFRYFKENEYVMGTQKELPFFYGDVQLNSAGCVAYYNLYTKESGIACEDRGVGKLYYMNGMFYTEAFDFTGTTRVVNRFWPNGSGMETYTESDYYSSIWGINDKNYKIAIETGQRIISDNGTIYSDSIYVEDSGFVINARYTESGLNAAILEFGDEKKYDGIIFKSLGISDTDQTVLGRINESDYAGEDFIYEDVMQIVEHDGYVYFAVVWYGGGSDSTYKVTSIDGYGVFRAVPGEEDSIEVVQKGLPKGITHLPFIEFDNHGEITYIEKSFYANIGLSAYYSGDLLRYDGEGYYTLVKENYVETNPYEAEIGDIVTSFEYGETIGNNTFTVRADSCYRGQFMYDWMGFTYEIIDSDGKSADIEPETETEM